ncbi:hypothetical protein FQN60_018417 [Etheostoma spectabile]|uniref:Uncharacterized protein n=1 Tax=Etheostoma spectabile TaxID=54343 RepID=A0A5J5DHZ7_9PERO|nr:hypothetical protein FQN60_018417 [Etheostoma spectabile]
MHADTDPDTGNPSTIKHHHCRHHVFQMQTLVGDKGCTCSGAAALVMVHQLGGGFGCCISRSREALPISAD